MPKKPSPALTLSTFDNVGTPSSTQLQRSDVVSDTISKIIAVDEAVSTWFAWRKAGKAPPCITLGPKVAAYRAGDIKAFVRATKASDVARSKSHKSPNFRNFA